MATTEELDQFSVEDCTDFGTAVGNLVNGVRGDGVSSARLGELINAVTTGAETVNEMKAVPEAATSYILGQAAITNGDAALARAREEAAEGGE